MSHLSEKRRRERRKDKPINLEIISPCGSCMVCCVALAIQSPEIKKAANSPCQHLTEKGCGIYRERPQFCKSYQCLWLEMINRGMQLPEAWRPNRLGLLIGVHTTPAGEVFVQAKELVDGAANTMDARNFFEWIVNSSAYRLIIVSLNGQLTEYGFG